MSQVLVINIKDGENVLASAYYHWGGYTKRAAYLLTRILADSLLESKEYNPLSCAVGLLAHTGAGFIKYGRKLEEEAIKATVPDDFISECVDRNYGIIEVTKDGIQDNKECAGQMIDIDIVNKRVCLDIFWEDEYNEYEPKSAASFPFDVYDVSYNQAVKVAAAILGVVEDKSAASLLAAVENKLYREERRDINSITNYDGRHLFFIE